MYSKCCALPRRFILEADCVIAVCLTCILWISKYAGNETLISDLSSKSAENRSHLSRRHDKTWASPPAQDKRSSKEYLSMFALRKTGALQQASLYAKLWVPYEFAFCTKCGDHSPCTSTGRNSLSGMTVNLGSKIETHGKLRSNPGGYR